MAHRNAAVYLVLNEIQKLVCARYPDRAIQKWLNRAIHANKKNVYYMHLAPTILVSVQRIIVVIWLRVFAVSDHFWFRHIIFVSVIDECASKQHDCDRAARCIDTDDSYICACPIGFIDNSPDPLNRPGRLCIAGMQIFCFQITVIAKISIFLSKLNFVLIPTNNRIFVLQNKTNVVTDRTIVR
jgi:hypothetical protein